MVRCKACGTAMPQRKWWHNIVDKVRKIVVQVRCDDCLSIADKLERRKAGYPMAYLVDRGTIARLDEWRGERDLKILHHSSYRGPESADHYKRAYVRRKNGQIECVLRYAP